MATHSMFLPEESQGWRSLAGCRLWGHKESDTTEQLIWSDLMDTLSWTKEARIYNGEKTISLTSGAGTTGQPLVKE